MSPLAAAVETLRAGQVGAMSARREIADARRYVSAHWGLAEKQRRLGSELSEKLHAELSEKLHVETERAARDAALDAWRESARVRRCLAREQIQRKVTISWAHAP